MRNVFGFSGCKRSKIRAGGFAGGFGTAFEFVQLALAFQLQAAGFFTFIAQSLLAFRFGILFFLTMGTI